MCTRWRRRRRSRENCLHPESDNPTDEPTKCYAQSALQVRLWSVPERRELALADVHEMATAAAWAPAGCRVAVGTLKGKVRFYAADDNGRLEYEAQIGAASHCTWECR